MAFIIAAIVALLAVISQSSLANPTVMQTTSAATSTTTEAVVGIAPGVAAPGVVAPSITAAAPGVVAPSITAASASAVSTVGAAHSLSAANTLNAVNGLANSPYIPNDGQYSLDLLSNYPYYMYCDCDFSSYLDATLVNEISYVSSRFNQRQCDIQQWDRIIQNNMPGINSINEVNMLSSLASSVQREQLRHDLAYTSSYPDFCLNYVRTLGATTPVATSSSSSSSIVLAKREPQVAAATSTTTTSSTTTAAPWMNSPYYYSMQYLFDRALPQISPSLRLDVINSIMANTPSQYWNMAYPMAQQLTSNIRGMFSEMVNLTPNVDVTVSV